MHDGFEPSQVGPTRSEVDSGTPDLTLRDDRRVITEVFFVTCHVQALEPGGRDTIPTPEPQDLWIAKRAASDGMRCNVYRRLPDGKKRKPTFAHGAKMPTTTCRSGAATSRRHNPVGEIVYIEAGCGL